MEGSVTWDLAIVEPLATRPRSPGVFSMTLDPPHVASELTDRRIRATAELKLQDEEVPVRVHSEEIYGPDARGVLGSNLPVVVVVESQGRAADGD